MMTMTNNDDDLRQIMMPVISKLCWQVPEEESKPANQHRSSVDMTSHPQVMMLMRVLIMTMGIEMRIVVMIDDTP